MNSIAKTSLFSDLSPQAASQTKGGHWVHSHGYSHSSAYNHGHWRWYSHGHSTATIRIRYYPASGQPGNTINITNSEIEDTSLDIF